MSVELRETMQPGARPSSVPPLAEWYLDSNEWVLCDQDLNGELHGSLRAYFADGTPSLEFEYRHGKRHGPFRRFYASGRLARAGRYFEDVQDGLLSVYSDGDDTYTIRECCIPVAARVMRQEHRRGELLAESFYGADGSLLVDEAGGPGASGWPQPLRERQDDVLLSEFDFWPVRETLAAAEGAAQVEQPLPAVRDAIQRAALRLASIRVELQRQNAPRLPPDASSLIAAGAPLLRRFSFVSAGDEPSTTVNVDETLSVGELDARELEVRARLEWTTLCWLCWAAGLDRIELPDRLAARPELYRALVTVSERQARLTGHELRPDRAAHFHGLDETLLPASALAHLAEHYREIRAVLLFVSDPECHSPWQDDLGRDEGQALAAP